MLAYRYHSIEPEGVWTSEPFPSAERRHIVQGVIGGFLSGRPRWATDLDGAFIYGLDAKGKEMKSAPSTSAAGSRRHATKKFETEAEQVARTNGWTVAYAAGWLDGRTQARHGQRRDPSLQTAKDDYARGYSLGYTEVAPSPTRHHATKKSPAQLQREIDAVLRGDGDRDLEASVDLADPPRLSPADPARRFADLQLQGFMRGVKTRRAAKPKEAPPIVSCEACRDWHRKGKHTAPAAQRKINLKELKERRAQDAKERRALGLPERD